MHFNDIRIDPPLRRCGAYTLCYLHSKCSTISEPSHAPMIERISAHTHRRSRTHVRAHTHVWESYGRVSRTGNLNIVRRAALRHTHTLSISLQRHCLCTYLCETLYQELQIKQSHLHAFRDAHAFAQLKDVADSAGDSAARRRQSIARGFLSAVGGQNL